MKRIYLSGRLGIDKFAVVDDEDYEYLNQWKWYAVPHRYTWYACHQSRIYLPNGKSKQREIWMHREVLNITDKSILVDHKDRDGLNNQKSNLRPCTNSQNRRNAKLQINNTSGYKGVCRDGRWYRARIIINKKRVSLGYFHNPVDAALAYDKAASEHYGEFALLNFPENYK